MTGVKTESVTFRILPEIKAALREQAEREHRSLANMLEVMIRDWCQQRSRGQRHSDWP
ncbi:ribbon-helix-helix protein, CopG family [Thiocystis minor]|uniref:ribbon-helix-helix protein, CopG family n=1 Tax=Thiocystis minor TaxID=61597 RepID=UPI001912655A|nr:ribbon-helix-helix protein, CopG family [Thiocystis minor]